MSGQEAVVNDLMMKFDGLSQTNTAAGQFLRQVKHEANRVNGETTGNELADIEYQQKLAAARQKLELMKLEHEKMDLNAVAQARANQVLVDIQTATSIARATTVANNKKVLDFVHELESPEMKKKHDQRLLSEVTDPFFFN